LFFVLSLEAVLKQLFSFAGVAVLLVIFSARWGSAQAARAAKFDGPAELPRVYVASGMADTPANGKVLTAKDSAELQAALDKSQCGDRILLAAGAQFVGNFTFPAKSCDDRHWLIVRTGAPDSALPAEGTRITPCSAGVASLPARPAYACAAPAKVMAALVSNIKNRGPVEFEDGANHYRLLGLEITRGIPGSVIYDLVVMRNKGRTDHLVFDRDWIHGTAQDETTRGIALGGSTAVAVVDSYFSDFHCVAVTGTCLDAQTISGGVGDNPMGPYKIVNNFLEASGENIMFGGGPATVSPADIEIRHNHLFKPPTWRQGSTGFVGGTSGKPFIVKNLFELKNAQRVLFEDNVLDNVWGGFTQTGFAILLTPKNQSNLCPVCKTTDLTIRFCRVSHAANGMVMGTGLSDAGGAASGGARYSIHDIVFDDIDGKAYGGFGALFQITSTSPALRDISIAHVTGFAPMALFMIGVDADREKIINFNFTNNLVGAGENDFFSTGGGPKNCAFQPRRQGPAGVLKNCFASFTFSHNAVAGSEGGWPGGNFTPGNPSAVQMKDFKDGKGGDYRLCSAKDGGNCKKESPFRKAGSDGKDLGADIDAIQARTEVVE
jgi:hypothetical protein